MGLNHPSYSVLSKLSLLNLLQMLVKALNEGDAKGVRGDTMGLNEADLIKQN